MIFLLKKIFLNVKIPIKNFTRTYPAVFYVCTIKFHEKR
jgi:hypothetical protein